VTGAARVGLVVAVAMTATVVGGGCGRTTTADPSGEPTLLVQDEPGFGPLITDPSGAPVYLDTGRDRRPAPCVGRCTAEWIPLVVPDGATALAGVGVAARLIGTVARPGGGRQITFGGWPLYTYLGDRYTFTVTGNGQHAGGGTFHPVTPAGHAARPGP
jgi:predicted lipoprotein with Yx(FWY)xxD motif